jgi:integrase
MRWGELIALRRCDVDLEAGTVRVVRQLTELSSGQFVPGPPKSDAGKRVIVIPAAIMPVLRQHMNWFVQADDDGLVFTSPQGHPLRRTFRQRVWLPALQAAGLPTVHFHDLRHTGNTLAASAGAGLRELMDRMGHSTARAAMIYLHATDERQQAIAEALSKLAEDSRKRRSSDRSGTQRARKRRNAS